MKRRVLAVAMLGLLAGAFFAGLRERPTQDPADLFNLRAASGATGPSLISFDGNNGWLNTPPLGMRELRGKVVLVDFWTYTCINWRRTAPYIRAWSEKYKDKGLVVVGVHTPEFSFEHDLANVAKAVKDIGVPYAVVLDSDYRIWHAFENQYWPNVFLIDGKGQLRYTHPGEGEYERTERMIQQLLAEGGAVDVPKDSVKPQGMGAEAPPDFANVGTPETYLGRAHGQLAAAAFSGRWTIEHEYAQANAARDLLRFPFHARDVHLVMGPSATQPKPVRFRVRIDGRAPGADRGTDVDEKGEGTIVQPRMYHLLRQHGRIDDRRLEIEFLDAGARAYVFTFG